MRTTETLRNFRRPPVNGLLIQIILQAPRISYFYPNYNRMSIEIEFDETRAVNDPFIQFEIWYKEAIMNEVPEPNAMVVSTVGEHNRPSSRVVYMRDVSHDGFVFFTNYRSRKGSEISANAFVCANFFWPQVGRQVRIEGKIAWLGDDQSDAYFSLRARNSCIGAWASPQSQPLASRKELDELVDEMTRRFEGKVVPRPEWWGGLRIIPDYFEFWHGRDSRLHDRLTYQLNSDNEWTIQRIAP